METAVVWVLLIGLALLLTRTWLKARRDAARRKAAELEAVRRTAEEDVTRLGEEVAALDLDTAGVSLDEGGRQDWSRALDSYEVAKQALSAMTRPEDVRAVTEALEDGRYAAACVRARVDGRPLPVRRPPCFFNPQHGPSVEDVPWAPPGGVPRPVPSCAADAERVRAGAEPDERKVLVDGRRRPYWQGGRAYAPYAGGYFGGFAGSGLLPGVLMGALIGGAFTDWGADPSGHGGGDGGGSDGGDGGGSDGGDGGDGGGSDAGFDQGGMGMDDSNRWADPGAGDHGGFDFGGGFDGGGFDGGF
ncbi:MAG: hypothetical protein ACRDYU_07610 [Actinomycetes bacterium]